MKESGPRLEHEWQSLGLKRHSSPSGTPRGSSLHQKNCRLKRKFWKFPVTEYPGALSRTKRCTRWAQSQQNLQNLLTFSPKLSRPLHLGHPDRLPAACCCPSRDMVPFLLPAGRASPAGEVLDQLDASPPGALLTPVPGPRLQTERLMMISGHGRR